MLDFSQSPLKFDEMKPQTDQFGSPLLIPKTTITFIAPYTDVQGRTILVPIPMPVYHGHKDQPKASIDRMTYVYIGVGITMFLLGTSAVIFLIIWIKKKNIQQRVVQNATDMLQ